MDKIIPLTEKEAENLIKEIFIGYDELIKELA